MKPRAIVSFLWFKNVDVMANFLEHHSDVLLISASGLEEVNFDGLRKRFGERVIDMSALMLSGDFLELELLSRNALGSIDGLASDAGFAQFSRQQELDLQRFLTEVKGLAASQVPWVARFLFMLRKVNQLFDVSLLVLSEDVTMVGRVLTEWARANAIPSLVLTHGVLLSSAYTVHKGLHADVAAVYGARGAETYLDIGVAPQRIRITGNPAWDIYAQQNDRKKEIRTMLCERVNFDQSRPIVVFATTWAAALTAHSDISIYQDSIQQFLTAMAQVRAQGSSVQIVIKDRTANSGFGKEMTQTMFAQHGLVDKDTLYTAESPEAWVIAADVLIAVDSNISIEALIAKTPAINLMNDFGLLIGPSFDADSGIFEVGPDELAETVVSVLTNAKVREQMIEAGTRRLSYYNEGVDGNAKARVVHLMNELLRPADTEEIPVWQTYLNVSDIEATGYHAHARSELFEHALHPPRVLLDIGCAAGATGAWAKRQYPGCVAYGIELNRAAANVASQVLDRVWIGKFEEIDFEKEGISKGSIDTVVVADVLEHMYNPWQVLVGLKPWLSPDAQILASIPNVRNLVLMQDLANGYWKYEPEGLLDVTHIRFFTLKEVKKFFYETGFHLNHLVYGIDQRLTSFLTQHMDKGVIDVELGRTVIRSVGYEELKEMCSLQFFCVASLGRNADDISHYAHKPEIKVKNEYLNWLTRQQIGKVEGELFEQRFASNGKVPLVEMFVYLVGDEAEGRLTRTMNSLAKLAYDNFRVTVLADREPSGRVDVSERFRWATFTGNPISAINECVFGGSSDWLAFISAGDEVATHALLAMVERGESNSWKIVYSDEDLIVKEDTYDHPNLKPDFNLDLLRSTSYIGGMLLVNGEGFKALEGFETRWTGAEEYDLVLRCVEVFTLDSVGHVADVLLHRYTLFNAWGVDEDTLADYRMRALLEHLQRLGISANIETGLLAGSTKVNYLPESNSFVSILIPVCGDSARLKRCIETILERTDYLHFEIILGENGVADAELLHYLNQITELGDSRLKVVSITEDKALPGIYNILASHAVGDYLLFFHPDNAVVYADWLRQLLGYAQRSEVGLVSPRMVDSRYRIRGAGYIAGMNGVAQALFSDQLLDYDGYAGRAKLTQNFTALPAGCLLLKRVIFQAAYGFDDVNFPWAFYEIDLAWRIHESGLLNVWTPNVTVLAEQESVDADWKLVRFKANEREKLVLEAEKNLYQRWIKLMGGDPYYNVNLRLSGEPFKIDMRTVQPKNATAWNPVKRIMAIPGDLHGCGHYRILSPARHLTKHVKANAMVSLDYFLPSEISKLELDTIVLQRQLLLHQRELIRRYCEINKETLLVFEIDDLFTSVPVKSLHRKDMPRHLSSLLKDALGLVHRLVVSTEPIKEAYSGLIDDVRIVKNTVERSIWGDLKPQRRVARKPRVGWAGGISHTGDLQLIADVVKETANEVDWVFLGMFPEGTRAYLADLQEGVPLDKYPEKLASLNLDLAVAPLEMNAFNESKSNLRLLEYGVLGYPVICTDITPYQDVRFPITRVKNSTENWVNAIREHISDLDETAKMGDRLRQHVLQNWMLEDHLDDWLWGWLR